jgi:hypothetical protein
LNFLPHCLSQIPETLGTADQQTNEELCVKKYKRSDANFEFVAEDIRTVPTLERAMDHLMNVVINDDRKPFFEVHNFIRDRVRSVLQDLSIQALPSQLGIEIVITFSSSDNGWASFGD